MRRESEEVNNRADKAQRRDKIFRDKGSCPICPPHDGENRTRSKHGGKKKRKNDKWRDKDIWN